MLQVRNQNREPISTSSDRKFPIQDNRHLLPFGKMSLRSPFREGIRNFHSLVKWSELHRRWSCQQCFAWSKVQMIQKIQFPWSAQTLRREIRSVDLRCSLPIRPLPFGNKPGRQSDVFGSAFDRGDVPPVPFPHPPGDQRQ